MPRRYRKRVRYGVPSTAAIVGGTIFGGTILQGISAPTTIKAPAMRGIGRIAGYFPVAGNVLGAGITLRALKMLDREVYSMGKKKKKRKK